MSVASCFCRIEMLGTLQVVLPDRVIDRFRTRKAALLLAYLAHHPNRTHPREHLIALFWPDADLDAGRDSLTTVLTSLRRQLEPAGVVAGSVLEADRQKVRLNPDAFATDVAEFERLLATGLSSALDRDPSERARRLEQAVALYRGEFLAGHYEDWVILEQSRLTGRYGAALLALATAQEQGGNLQEALTAARRALAVDLYNEEACLLTMRLQARVGQAVAALETYGQLELRFREELNAAPGRALRELAARIRLEPETFQRIAAPAEAQPESHQALPQPQQATVSPAVAASQPPAPPQIMLPLQTTGFFGREREIKRLIDLLSPAAAPGVYAPKRRLVTLTGPGGVGKTRLAIEAARALAAGFMGGTWFISLADVPHPRLAPFALAHALQIRSAPNSDLLDQIVAKLNAAPCLLVLDNYEHLLRDLFVSKVENPNAADASVLVRLLLERAPQVSLLVTSRRALNLDGEQEFPLDVLSTPEGAHSAEDLLAYASVALYRDRAQYVTPDFALTARNAEAVGRLCRKLEGMPLAIEMAAAWVKTLPPGQMLNHLAERLDLLVSRRRDLPVRQRSLRATIEWSYDLLSEEQREFFAIISILRGSFAVEAACAIADAPIHVGLEMLSELQQHSLLVAEELEEEELKEEESEESETEMRYRLLEPLRQFGWEKLTASEMAETVQSRYLAYFLALAERSAAFIVGSDQAQWLKRLALDHDNFRTILACLTGTPLTGLSLKPDEALRLATALWRFWQLRGHLAEGRTYLKAALAGAGPERTLLRAKALIGAGSLAFYQADYPEARGMYEESLAISRELGDRLVTATALNNLGNIAWNQGDYPQAETLYNESLAIRRALGDRLGIATSLHNMAMIAQDRADYSRSRALYEESLAIRRELGDQWGVASCLHNLANNANLQEDYEHAMTLYRQSLAIREELGDRWGIASSLYNQGTVAMVLGDLETASRLCERSLAMQRELGDSWGASYALHGLARIAFLQGDIAASRRLHRECLRMTQELGNKTGSISLLDGVAQLANREGQLASAIRLLSAAAKLRETLDAPRTINERKTNQEEITAARKAAGEERFAREWAYGQNMTLDEAIALALA
jgi:predicted ATPase/DNA-binding SARP family transcriptional activator